LGIHINEGRGQKAEGSDEMRGAMKCAEVSSAYNFIKTGFLRKQLSPTATLRERQDRRQQAEGKVLTAL
jgi:hypothetical protein